LEQLDDNLMNTLTEFDIKNAITYEWNNISEETQKIIEGISGMSKFIENKHYRKYSVNTSGYSSKLYEIMAFCVNVKPQLFSEQEFADIRVQINKLLAEKITLLNEKNNYLLRKHKTHIVIAE
jgi:hypothetical protein